MNKDYITASDFAKLLKTTRQTVYTKMEAGEIPYVKLNARVFLIDRNEAKAWRMVKHGRKKWLEKRSKVLA